MSAEAIPSPGDHVQGTHLLGATYTGVIRSRRPHTIDRDTTIFEILFDKPTELGKNDVRESIIVQRDTTNFHGDTQWQDGHGGWFRVIGQHGLADELRNRFAHFYKQTDGTYRFPNSCEGDLLKMTARLLGILPSAPSSPHITHDN